MQLSSLMGNSQKLDGGAMFGNAPKALWTRWVPADERNRIDLACRALLVETQKHKILFETGIGCYMDPRMRDRYGVQEDHHVLLQSLAELGLAHTDITDIVLSHLHFDHSGGLLSAWQENEKPQLLFPRARFYVGSEAWRRATTPHPRDRASFIPELNAQLEASGRLTLLDSGERLRFDDLTVTFFISEGHTPGMLCSDLRKDDFRMVFAADLIPARPWVHVPITMGYDRFPERLIDEKKQLLGSLAANNWLFFTHDSKAAASRVNFDPEKHKYSPGHALVSFSRETFA